MISDMFPPERRATALAIYALGIPIGTMLYSGWWVPWKAMEVMAARSAA